MRMKLAPVMNDYIADVTDKAVEIDNGIKRDGFVETMDLARLKARMTALLETPTFAALRDDEM